MRSINVLDSCICYCRCITSWPKFFCIHILIGLFLFFHLSGWNITIQLVGTPVELVEPETLSQLAFELLSQLRLSQYTIGIPYQSSDEFCSLIHLWSLRYHRFLLFMFCHCGWDCVSLEVLLGIHVPIFWYSCFHLVFLSIPLNRRLQWNLLFSRLFQESCCLVLIRLTGWSSST